VKNSAPDFREMLTWLMTEVIFGRAHFTIVLGLLRADGAVLGTAPRFFALTLDAHANLAVMAASRIFDRHPDSISIHTVMAAALRDAVPMDDQTQKNEIRKTVAEAKVSVESFRPILNAIRVRRNKSMAHSAAETLIDPDAYIKDGFLEFRELDGLFDATNLIIDRLAGVYGLNTAPLRLPDANDYEKVLELIAAKTKREGARDKN
jgi:hypothetical protein